MSGQLNLQSILERNRLTGPNYVDWLRNLKFVLIPQGIDYVIEAQVPELASDASAREKTRIEKWKHDDRVARCLILGSMSNELQRQHEHLNSYDIMQHLKELYGVQSRAARYQISKQLFRARMKEGDSVQDHVLKMIDWIEHLAQLGIVIHPELSIDLILQSLSDSFSQFVLNFHMNKLEATLPELLNMLRTAEESLTKDKGKAVLVVESSKKSGSSKKSMKKKNDKKKAVKVKSLVKKVKVKSQVADKCHHCGKNGHWRRNCKDYLASLKKLGEASSSGTEK